jgi:hypothetical protein
MLRFDGTRHILGSEKEIERWICHKQSLVELPSVILHKLLCQITGHSKSFVSAIVNRQHLTVRREISGLFLTGDLFCHFGPPNPAMRIGNARSLHFDEGATQVVGLWLVMPNWTVQYHEIHICVFVKARWRRSANASTGQATFRILREFWIKRSSFSQ